MGRGGGRSKASSTGTTFEADAAFIPVDLNTTLIEFILTGHFEVDLYSYCSNRLSDYTCKYWFDPNRSDGGKTTTSSFFQSQVPGSGTSASPFSKGSSGSLETHSEMMFRFSDPAKIPVSLYGGVGSQGWDKTTNETCLLLSDLVPLTVTPQHQLFATILCAVFLCSMLATLVSWHCLRRLVLSDGLSIVKFLVYLSFLESIDLCLGLMDNIMNATHGIPLFTVMEFLGRWACQTLAMGYTCLKHLEGLLITILAINVLAFTQQLRHHLIRFKKEWAYNAFILIIALMATTSSQFFWTFDLFYVDNRIPSTESNVGGGVSTEPALYMCGFSASWGLNHAYVSYIWPEMDHLLGDILPCLVPLIAGFVMLAKHRQQARENRINMELESKGNLEEFMWILPAIFLLHGFSILPRMVFYLAKHTVFSENHVNRVGLIFHREDSQSSGDSTIVTAIAKVIPFRHINWDLRPHLWAIENTLRFFFPVFTLVRSLLVIFGFSTSRRILRTGINRFHAFFSLRRSKKTAPKERNSSKGTVKPSPRQNNVETIPFTMLEGNSSTRPRVEPAKHSMYIRSGDIEELVV